MPRSQFVLHQNLNRLFVRSTELIGNAWGFFHLFSFSFNFSVPWACTPLGSFLPLHIFHAIPYLLLVRWRKVISLDEDLIFVLPSCCCFARLVLSQSKSSRMLENPTNDNKCFLMFSRSFESRLFHALTAFWFELNSLVFPLEESAISLCELWICTQQIFFSIHSAKYSIFLSKGTGKVAFCFIFFCLILEFVSALLPMGETIEGVKFF